MKKLVVILLCLIPVVAWGAIGTNTSYDFSPDCVILDEEQAFAVTLHFMSPDGERLTFAQFWIGDFWDIGTVQDPAAVDVPGTWSHVVNPAGNVISWSFAANSGQGGDVGTGHSITFQFDATPTLANDLDLFLYIEGDTTGGSPHTMNWAFSATECADDDVTDDDVTDDDVTDDDSDDDVTDDDSDDDVTDDDSDDDVTDDDSDDDVTDDDSDDDVTDDDISDDDTAGDDDVVQGNGADDDDDDSDGGSPCGF